MVYDRHPVITKETLSQWWGIGLNTTHHTLRMTMQCGVHMYLHPLDRCMTTWKPHLVFPMMCKKFYTDTLSTKVKSIQQNMCAQDWTDGQGYTLFYPLRSKSEAYMTIPRMVHDLNGIPEVIVADGAKEEGSLKWAVELQLIWARQHVMEPYSQWQNQAEQDI